MCHLNKYKRDLIKFFVIKHHSQREENFRSEKEVYTERQRIHPQARRLVHVVDGVDPVGVREAGRQDVEEGGEGNQGQHVEVNRLLQNNPHIVLTKNIFPLFKIDNVVCKSLEPDPN